MYGMNTAMEVLPDGRIEILSPRHWWCVGCGRWEECDDSDRCRECAWVWRGRERGPQRRRRGPVNPRARA